MPKYKIRVTVYESKTADFNVIAESEEEAQEIAMEMYEECADDLDSTYEDEDIETLEEEEIDD